MNDSSSIRNFVVQINFFYFIKRLLSYKKRN